MTERPPHVTQHAIDRYRQRVADLPDDEIVQALNTPRIIAAINSGAQSIVLPSGNRARICNGKIVTIRPKRQKLSKVINRKNGKRTLKGKQRYDKDK